MVAGRHQAGGWGAVLKQGGGHFQPTAVQPLAIGREAEPGEIGADRLDIILAAAFCIGIVDTQQEPAAGLPAKRKRGDRLSAAKSIRITALLFLLPEYSFLVIKTAMVVKNIKPRLSSFKVFLAGPGRVLLYCLGFSFLHW